MKFRSSLANLVLCGAALLPIASTAQNLAYAIKDLGTLGGAMSCAYSVNNERQIVGESINWAGNLHSFLYSQGALTDLGAVTDPWSIAKSINKHGDIVGYALFTTVGSYHAFLYKNGTMKDLSVRR